jgi:hypothetical protein
MESPIARLAACAVSLPSACGADETVAGAGCVATDNGDVYHRLR